MRPLAPTAISVLALAACSGGGHPIPEIGSSEPRLFLPGVVSTEMREYGISFSPDLTTAYFTRRLRRGSPQIFETHFVEGAWTEPRPTPFAARAEAPFVADGGARIVYSSTRPLPVTGDRSANLWEVHRVGDGWSEPRPLAGQVNQPEREVGEYEVGDESGPVVLADGTLIYGAGTDPVWGDDLYVAETDDGGAYGSPRPLRISSVADESHPAVSPDGRYLVFTSYGRPRGVGEADLYVSIRTEHGWSEPRPLPEPVNSRDNDGYPSFTPDGRYLFFASDRASRYYSIYYLRVADAGLEPD